MKRRRAVIRIAGVSASALLLLSATPASGHADTATPAPAATGSTTAPAAGASGVTLNGEGASDPSAELTTWQNDLYGANGQLNLDYISTGGYRARQDLLSGAVDYAISGVPFTPAELAKLPNGSHSLIDAPVMASGLGVLVTPPFNNQPAAVYGPPGYGWGVLTVADNPPKSPYVPYLDPLKVPTVNLAAMILHYGEVQPDTSTPFSEWDNPNVVSAFGLKTSGPDVNGNGAFFEPAGAYASPTPYLRSDPGETDYYSELLAATAAPAVWQGLQHDFRTTFTVSDALPPVLSTVSTAQGLPAQLDKLYPTSVSTGDLLLPGFGYPGGGSFLVAVPPSGLSLLDTKHPKNVARWISAQNANGDWLTPSPASIEAAVNAGGNTPLYGLNNKVPGAYPFTYVNHLYAPAHGLSVDKTEALATTIRYLATDGQGTMEANGDGKLSTALVAQALAAANQLVLSNCTGPGASLVQTSDPGRLAPDLPGLKAIGSMLHCDPPATPSSAPAAASPTAGGAVSTPSGFVPVSSADTSPTGATTAASGGGAPGSAPAAPTGKPGAKGPGHSALTLASLPIPLPFSGVVTFDRLAALVIGALFFFLGRRVVSWLARLARP